MRIPHILVGLIMATGMVILPALWGKPLTPILAGLLFGGVLLVFLALGKRAYSDDNSPFWRGLLFAVVMFLGTFIRYHWVLERPWPHAAGIAVLGAALMAAVVSASEGSLRK
jgi:hypothetical protein